MTTLIYDGSWQGFLTAVFMVYEYNYQEPYITRRDFHQSAMFGAEVDVWADEAKASRVWVGLQKKVSKSALNDIWNCYLSGLPEIETTLLAYIRQVIAMPGSESAYAHPAVLRIAQVSKMVYREKHRMEAFVRFKRTKDDIYYASIEPDYNVLPLISEHFEKRYADQYWIIYDLKRGYGIFYNQILVEEITLQWTESCNDGNLFAEDEGAYQTLWSDYFEHVNIPERKNLKLHLQHVPKRYWKHLNEKRPKK
jgi:probable DNA metabolism protein